MREAMRIRVKMNTQELAVVVGVGMGSALETGMTEGAYYARLRVLKSSLGGASFVFVHFIAHVP